MSPLHEAVAPVQAAVLLGEHFAHAPAVAPAVRHAPPFLLPMQSVSLAQGPHVESIAHTGFGFVQSVLTAHATQVCLVVSHVVGALHCVESLHETQRPLLASLDTSHTPLGAQSWSIMHARQMLFTTSHTGVAPLQSVFATQATHASVEVSQTGVAPLHPDLSLAVH